MPVAPVGCYFIWSAVGKLYYRTVFTSTNWISVPLAFLVESVIGLCDADKNILASNWIPLSNELGSEFEIELRSMIYAAAIDVSISLTN